MPKATSASVFTEMCGMPQSSRTMVTLRALLEAGHFRGRGLRGGDTGAEQDESDKRLHGFVTVLGSEKRKH